MSQKTHKERDGKQGVFVVLKQQQQQHLAEVLTKEKVTENLYRALVLYELALMMNITQLFIKESVKTSV